jgi:hypothetical protein
MSKSVIAEVYHSKPPITKKIVAVEVNSMEPGDTVSDD